MFWLAGAFTVFFMLLGSNAAKADFQITDNLSVTGFLRYELGLHTGGKNHNNIYQDDNHDFTISRHFLVTEWTYDPCDHFKLFTKARFIADETDRIDSNLGSYNAFPVDVSKNDWTLMKAGKDDYRAEIWELYGDMKLGNLWLRLGKQQIVWGEMIGTRILDVINPLDMSWNMNFEPEEFENIRIPNWSIRGSYLIDQPVFDELSIEGFLNPGDILPTQMADFGAPFNVMEPFPPFMRIDEKDRRGDVEYGLRMGYQIKGVYGTFCYLHLYDDSFKLETKGFVPDDIFGVPLFAPLGDLTPYAMLLDAEYQVMDIYGMTLNYDIPYPYNLVFTYEGAWIPNQPYQDRESSSPGIKDLGTFNWALRIDRNTGVFPPRFLGTDFQYMKITLQFSQNIREGDEDKVAGPGSSKIDKTDEMIIFKITQPFSHANWEPMIQFVYDPDDAYLVKPGVKYVHGDHWYFDLYGIITGGSEKRPGRLGAIDYANEVFGRVTYQF